MEEVYINHIAVGVCAFLNLVVGAIWYSPALFYKSWLKETGLNDELLRKVNPVKMYGISVILSWLISYNLAFFLGDEATDWQWGLAAGFLTGLGFSALIFAVIAIFEKRSLRYILINAGYITVYFSLIGLILGIWR